MDREKIIRIIDELIFEAQKEPTWKTENALRCLKKELLKEQETTIFKPHYIDKYGKNFICGVECGSCHKEISSIYHYCPYCGKPITWESR